MTLWADRMLLDNAVYWEPPIRDGLGGYTWSYPIEIKTRWQQIPKLVYGSDGSEIMANSIVWVLHDVVSGGYLWKGQIDDIQTIFEPVPDFSSGDQQQYKIRDLASQIVSVKIISSIVDETSTLVRAFLV